MTYRLLDVTTVRRNGARGNSATAPRSTSLHTRLFGGGEGGLRHSILLRIAFIKGRMEYTKHV